MEACLFCKIVAGLVIPTNGHAFVLGHSVIKEHKKIKQKLCQELGCTVLLTTACNGPGLGCGKKGPWRGSRGACPSLGRRLDVLQTFLGYGEPGLSQGQAGGVHDPCHPGVSLGLP